MPKLRKVYSERLSVDYLAPQLSSANLYHLLTFPLIAIISVLLTFATQGLWRRTNTYLEQPIIGFRDHLFFVFFGHDGRPAYFWNSFEGFRNQTAPMDLWTDRLMLPALETNQRDFDEDWKPDEINIHAIFREAADGNSSNFSMENVSSIFYALFFDVQLERRAWLELQSAPIIGQIPCPSNSATNELSVVGILDFQQLRPLPWYGNYTVPGWSPPQITALGNGENDDGFADLMDSWIWHLKQYVSLQNYSISICRKSEHWHAHRLSANSSASNPSSLFHFNFRARIREQILHYRTNALEMCKWAWIQFVALFIIVKALFSALSSFLFRNQILGTIISTQCGEKKRE